MIIPLLAELRRRKVPVGVQELVALTEALAKGLHDSSLQRFYYIARAVLIHDEAYLDDFEQAFGAIYKGIPSTAKDLLDQLDEWLKDPRERPNLTEEEKALLEELDLDQLKKMFEERLREQKERHEGGAYWIGTGGRSPFGTNGYHPTGISLRRGPPSPSGGGRSMVRSADARRYRSYRHDLTLDTRQVEVALRKLRSFDREGARSELDLDRSVDETARNFGELELVFRKPRRPDTRVILMMDVGGSMDPYATLVSQLFTAAKRATHWKELRTYYFHNCIYGHVFRTEGLREGVRVRDLFRECDGRYKLIFVGDASMAPYELLGWDDPNDKDSSIAGLQWLAMLRNHFKDSVWLNPDGTPSWHQSGYGNETTVEYIARIFPMFPLTINGLDEALSLLKRRR